MEILARPQNLNLCDGRGRTALHLAVYQKMTDIIKVLIDKKAAVNLRDSDGETALMLAARYGPQRSVMLLTKNGASAHLKNNEGKTALDIAREARQYGIANYLDKFKRKK